MTKDRTAQYGKGQMTGRDFQTLYLLDGTWKMVTLCSGLMDGECYCSFKTLDGVIARNDNVVSR